MTFFLSVVRGWRGLAAFACGGVEGLSGVADVCVTSVSTCSRHVRVTSLLKKSLSVGLGGVRLFIVSGALGGRARF